VIKGVEPEGEKKKRKEVNWDYSLKNWIKSL